MIELDWIRSALCDKRISIVAKETGLAFNTVKCVRNGIGNPTIDTLNRITEYLKRDGDASDKE